LRDEQRATGAARSPLEAVAMVISIRAETSLRGNRCSARSSCPGR